MLEQRRKYVGEADDVALDQAADVLQVERIGGIACEGRLEDGVGDSGGGNGRVREQLVEEAFELDRVSWRCDGAGGEPVMGTLSTGSLLRRALRKSFL